MASSLDSVARHRRSPGVILRALFEKRHYVAAATAFARVEAPVDFLKRYISNGGRYPAEIRVKTPLGPMPLTTWSSDDVQTINEIFLRGDYDVPEDGAVIVDFGSNIGISAAWFLSRRPDAFIHCFEPLASNTARLRQNLAQFPGRWELQETAVGTADGTVRFGWEPTGRYGGVGRNTGNWVDVPCRDSNAILAEVIQRHGHIDTLKIDIETLEEAVTCRIPAELIGKIRHLVVEYPFTSNPFPDTHSMERRHSVTLLARR